MCGCRRLWWRELILRKKNLQKGISVVGVAGSAAAAFAIILKGCYNCRCCYCHTVSALNSIFFVLSRRLSRGPVSYNYFNVMKKVLCAFNLLVINESALRPLPINSIVIVLFAINKFYGFYYLYLYKLKWTHY